MFQACQIVQYGMQYRFSSSLDRHEIVLFSRYLLQTSFEKPLHDAVLWSSVLNTRDQQSQQRSAGPTVWMFCLGVECRAKRRKMEASKNWKFDTTQTGQENIWNIKLASLLPTISWIITTSSGLAQLTHKEKEDIGLHLKTQPSAEKSNPLHLFQRKQRLPKEHLHPGNEKRLAFLQWTTPTFTVSASP